MSCTAPLRVYRSRDGGPVSFVFSEGMEPMELACGRCTGCRLHRAAMWSLRCQHEASLYDENSFLTLTYDEDHVPPFGSLRYRDVQVFLRRMRKRIAPKRVRFFCVGEYGSKTLRPHYHMLLFGVSFERGRDWSRSWPARVSESATVSELWRHGSHHIGSVSAGSCSYCARYALKKVYGRAASDAFYHVGVDRVTGEVQERVPEFVRMSLRPGIGRGWYERFSGDVLPRDYVVGGEGRRYRVPRYYEKLYGAAHPLEIERVAYERELRLLAPAVEAERTPARRRVREEILRARVSRSDEARLI